ncbi:MAG TPA: xanthine dehydrogenase family protein subunit M [Pyrinomonadaceae bacterium]|jgi:CO/xanthine dehydrogenase FAD-binding subunit
MRAYLPEYELKTPRDLGAALEVLAAEPGVWKPFAGGTDLMVLFEAGRLAHKRFLNIRNLGELRGIDVSDEHITLGALTTYTDVRRSEVLQSEFPMLCRAASETGGLAIQNRGTLGGNIVNASPAADSPPALLVYDAELELLSAAGSRRVSYAEFHTGYKQMSMRPEELLGRIRLPRRHSGLRHYYRKVGTRKAQAISKICFAGAARVGGGRIEEIRIALGSVAPTVVRATKTEEVLTGQRLDAGLIKAAREALSKEIVPIDDIRSTATYRLRVAANVLEDFLLQLQA